MTSIAKTMCMNSVLLQQSFKLKYLVNKYSKRHYLSNPLNWKSLLTSEEILIYETARAYSNDKLQGRILEATRNEYFDVNIMRGSDTSQLQNVITASIHNSRAW